MRVFPMYKLVYNLSRSDMQSNYGKFKPTTKFNAKNWSRAKASVLAQLAKVEGVCERSGFPTAEAIADLRRRIAANDRHIISTLGTQIASIRNEICRNFNRLAYLEIPSGKVKFFEQPYPLFGEDVHKNFESSKYDISEAGKCLALDRGTASVMHAMRALEPALLAMASSVDYRPDREDWARIIDEIEKRLDPKNSLYIKSRSKREFLAPATAQFRYFKDAWRNHAMHARETYNPEQAECVYNAVKGFMMHLATKFKE